MREADKEKGSYTESRRGTETNMQVSETRRDHNMKPCLNNSGIVRAKQVCDPTQALEEALAEACQLGLESDWQREVVQLLQQADAEQERKSERLAELHRETLAGEERLADTLRDVAGRKVRAAGVGLVYVIRFL